MLLREKRGGFEMGENKKSSKIINLSDLAFERDKKNANVELRDYFVKKNRQIKAAQLISAMKSSLKKEVFSCSEAKQLAGFLARKFDIRGPAIQYAQAGYLSPGPISNKGLAQTEKNKKTPLRRSVDRGNDLFHELFLRLQSAVQENLLDYNGARVLVRDIVISYPTSRDSLMR
ncbi:MAG: hypothetical protein ACI8PB_003336 [Desulforhopalus sp.]|jgi:hypothetical protein